jgi:spermidine/putrescine transport system permease protein
MSQKSSLPQVIQSVSEALMPDNLYAKMVAGYTPGVPVLGTVSTVGAAILLIGGYGAILAMRRSKSTE